MQQGKIIRQANPYTLLDESRPRSGPSMYRTRHCSSCKRRTKWVRFTKHGLVKISRPDHLVDRPHPDAVQEEPQLEDLLPLSLR